MGISNSHFIFILKPFVLQPKMLKNITCIKKIKYDVRSQGRFFCKTNLRIYFSQEEDEAASSRKTSVDDLESHLHSDLQNEENLHNVDLNSTNDEEATSSELGCDNDSLDGDQVRTNYATSLI